MYVQYIQTYIPMLECLRQNPKLPLTITIPASVEHPEMHVHLHAEVSPSKANVTPNNHRHYLHRVRQPKSS